MYSRKSCTGKVVHKANLKQSTTQLHMYTGESMRVKGNSLLQQHMQISQKS